MKSLPRLVSAVLLCAITLTAQMPDGMTRIRAGTFIIGTNPADIDALMAKFGVKRRELLSSETPAHQTNVQSFLIDRTEVTNVAFSKWQSRSFPPNEAEFPVTLVTWSEASDYCVSQGKRLPTETEWEVAAQGGTSAEFPWGDEMPDASRANWLGSGIGKPTRVGSYPPNPAGLFDMAGNVWEFVQDEWKNDYLPTSSASSDRRVIRGGSFGGSPVNLRVRYRDSHPVNAPGPHVGFRCARS